MGTTLNRYRLAVTVLAVAIAAITSTALGVVVHRRVYPPVAPPPSDKQASDLLFAKWRQALTEGKTAFCAGDWGGYVCEEHWDRAGGDKEVPRTPPRIVASHASQTLRWLTVCGTTGTGKPYEGEFAVTRTRGVVQPTFFVFWGPTHFLGVFQEGTEPRTTAERPRTEKLC